MIQDVYVEHEKSYNSTTGEKQSDAYGKLDSLFQRINLRINLFFYHII